MQDMDEGPKQQVGVAELNADAAKVAYLISELDKWLAEGVLAQNAYEKLHQRYLLEQEDIQRLIKVDHLLNDARSLQTLYKADDALHSITEALTLAPNNPDAISLLGAIYEDLKQYDKALSEYESLAKRYPDDTHINSCVTRTQKMLDLQRQLQEQAAELAGIAELARTGSTDNAISQCEAFTKNHPGNVNGYSLLASLYVSTNRMDDAINQLNLALKLTPNDQNLKEQIADLQQKKSRVEYEERQQIQREQAEKLHRRQVESAQELMSQASVLFTRGLYTQGYNSIRLSLSIDNNNPVAWALFGRICSAQQMWREAENAWMQAARLDPHQEECEVELQKATAARVYQERPAWNKLWDKAAQVVGAFMEERNIEWVHILGAAILLAGLIGVSAWVVTIQKLWGVVGKVFVATAPIALSALFYYSGNKLRKTLKATAVTLTVIASVLLPLDLIISKSLFPVFYHWDWYHHLLAVSILSTLVYTAVLSVSRTRTLVTFTGIGFLLTNFFFIRSFTSISPSSEGIWLAIIGFAYMVIARYVRGKGHAPLDTPIYVLAHVSMAWALGVNVFPGATLQSGGVQSVGNILAVSASYLAAAYISNEVRYLPVFATVLFGFIVLALKASGIGIEEWYLYGLSFGVIGCIFLGMAPVSLTQEKESFAGWYQWLGLGVTAISITAVLGKGVADVSITQMLPSRPELLSSLVTCILVSIFYTANSIWMRKPSLGYAAATVLTYSAILLLKLLSRQTYECTAWIMFFALIMASLGYYLKRRWDEYGQVVLNCGNALAASASVISVSMWLYQIHNAGNALAGYRDAAWIVMLLSTSLYGLLACASRRPVYIYPALVSATVWWAAGFSWLNAHYLDALIGAEVNYGLYYLPFVTLLIWIESIYRRQKNCKIAQPFEVISLFVSTAMMVLQGYYFSNSQVVLHSVWVSLLIYAMLFAWQSWDKKELTLFETPVSSATVFTCLSMLALWGSVFCGLNGEAINRAIIASLFSALYIIAVWAAARGRYPDYVQVPCMLGLAVLSIDVLLAIGVWFSTLREYDRLIAFIVTAAAAGIYGVYSTVTRSRWSQWAAMFTLAVAYGLAGSQWVMPHFSTETANYGIWLWPLTAVLACGGHVLHKNQESDAAWILLYTSASLAIISLCIQLLYTVQTSFIAFIAYGGLFVWTAVAARSWKPEEWTEYICERSTYIAVVLLTTGWLIMFEFIGKTYSQYALCRYIAALTGIVWCAVTFRMSQLVEKRDWQWWERPLFWSGLVFALLWNIWPIVWQQSILYFSTMVSIATIVLFTWMAVARGKAEIIWYGSFAAVTGYISLFYNPGGMQDGTHPLFQLAVTPAILAVCMGYISKHFRSVEAAHAATFAAGWAYFTLVIACIDITRADYIWLGLGLAVYALVILCVSNIVKVRGYATLAIAPLIGSNVFLLFSLIYTTYIIQSGDSNFWIPGVIALGICMTSYILMTYWRRCQWYLYPGCITVALTWGLVDWEHILKLVRPDYGLIFVPLVLVFGGISYAIRRKTDEKYAVPLWWSGLLLSIICAVSQIHVDGYYVPNSVCTTLFSLVVLYTVGSILDRSDPVRVQVLTYLACSTFLIGMACIPVQNNHILLSHRFMPLIYAFIGTGWAGKARFFKDRPWFVWTEPLFVSAGCAEVTALVVAVTHPDPTAIVWNVAAIMIAAAVLVLVANSTGNKSLIHLAGTAVLLGSLNLWQQTGYDFSRQGWILLLPTLVWAVGAAIIAQVNKSREYACWSAGLLWIGFCGYIMSLSSIPLSSAPIQTSLCVAAMGICAVLYQRLADDLEITSFHLLAALSGLAAYWYSLVLVHIAIPSLYNPEEHPAIVILPYAIFMAWVSRQLRDKDGAPLYSTYGAVSLGLAVLGTIYNTYSNDSQVMRAVISALYTISFIWSAARFASRFLVYLTNASAVLTWYLLYNALGLPDPGNNLPLFGAWFAALGVMMVALGIVFGRISATSDLAAVEYAIGTTLSSLSAVIALMNTQSRQDLGRWTILALILSTVTHSVMAMTYRKVAYVHAGFLGILFSLYLFFYGQLGLRVIDIYALPIGIYLLILPAISNYVSYKIRPNPCYTAGLIIMLGSGLITMMNTGWGSWNSYLMLIESVIAFLYGLSRHVKTFFFFGAVFSVMWAAVLIRDSVVRQLHGGTLVAGVLGIIVGGSLIIFAWFSEQKRAKILDSIRQAVQSFREWE